MIYSKSIQLYLSNILYRVFKSVFICSEIYEKLWKLFGGQSAICTWKSILTSLSLGISPFYESYFGYGSKVIVKSFLKCWYSEKINHLLYLSLKRRKIILCGSRQLCLRLSTAQNPYNECNTSETYCSYYTRTVCTKIDASFRL